MDNDWRAILMRCRTPSLTHKRMRCVSSLILLQDTRQLPSSDTALCQQHFRVTARHQHNSTDINSHIWMTPITKLYEMHTLAWHTGTKLVTKYILSTKELLYHNIYFNSFKTINVRQSYMFRPAVAIFRDVVIEAKNS